MASTRPYKETVVRRIQDDPEFAEALYAEALSSLVEGDKATALSILKDLVHARITFKRLAEKSGLGEKSLYRVFGPSGNPTLENLSTILVHIGQELGLKPSVTVTRTRKRRTRPAGKPYEPLGEGSQVRRPDGEFHGRDVNAFEDYVEELRDPGVTVVDKVVGAIRFTVHARNVAGDLAHPFPVRVMCSATHDDAAGADVNEEQDVE